MANFEDVIQQLIDTNNKLIKGEVDIKVAQHIAASTQVLINAARLQLDIFRTTQQGQRFIEQKTTLEDLKRIAQSAAEMNVEEDEKISDLRPFPFS